MLNVKECRTYGFVVAVLISLFVASTAQAESGRSDYDLDDDGLIEINDLADLNAIRYSLSGRGLYGENTGCPNTGCDGFELTADLNFDTNQDGAIDGNDDYWNDGAGWAPIGYRYETPFNARFNGNGHVVRHLTINRPSTSYVGLFGTINGADIRQLVLTEVNVIGRSNVGGLAGYARSNNTLEANTVMGLVESIHSGNANTGMLVGSIYSNNVIRANLVSGRVLAKSYHVGGLIGGIRSYNTVEGNLSTVWVEGYINSLAMGGLLGYVSYSFNILQNNYWATDASGQLTSHRSSEANSYVGLELATLRCGVMANTDYANSNCVSEDGAAEGLSGPVTVFKDWDTYGVTDTNGVFQPYWDFGSNQQLPALNLNGIIHRDSDGDGVADDIDVYPLNFAASKDSDQDGYIDAWTLGCDAQCRADSGLILDGFPNQFAAYLDADLDGLPDAWNPDCDDACQINSGLTLDPDNDNDGVDNIADAFPLNAAAAVDTDQDGFPDAWADNCDVTCQSESGLVLDVSLNDTDNDGVVDAEDPNNGADNGAPTLMEVPSNQSFTVTNESGSLAEVSFDSVFYQGFIATDLVSSYLEFTPALNGVDLTLNENDQYQLPAGLNSVEWTAIDEAGNRSNVVIQVIKVFPRVKFSMAVSETGEPSTANIIIELTGDAPEYPVQVMVDFDELSDADASDVGEEFDLEVLHSISIGRGEGNTPNRLGYLEIPVVDDGESENDEQLNILLQSIVNPEVQDVFYTIDENHNQHGLTITDINLAPVVTLTVQQGGEVVTEIAQDGGDVTITASIVDGNGNDTHTISWGLIAIGIAGTNEVSVTFDPQNLSVGEYTLNIEVTDNGINPLSGTAELVITVLPLQREDQEQEAETSAEKDSSGGAIWICMLLLFLLAGYRPRRWSNR